VAQFPNELQVGDMHFPLHYVFEPGHQQDGVNIRVPIHALHLLPEAQLEWLVPGLLREKCIELIKSLPKNLRKQFVPVPDAVDKLLPLLLTNQINGQPLTTAITKAAAREFGVDIPGEAWQQIQVDDYYRFNIQVVDEQGKVIDQSRDLAALRTTYKQRLQSSLRSVGDDYEQQGLQDWTFAELHEDYQLQKGSITTIAFPALIDKETCVDLRLLDDRERAKIESRRGIARLLLLQLKQQTKYFRKDLFKRSQQQIVLLGLGDINKLQDDVLMTAIDAAAELQNNLPRTHAQFEHCLSMATPKFTEQVNALAKILTEAIYVYTALVQQLAGWRDKPAFQPLADDIRGQLQDLFRPGFVYASGADFLQQLPRFLQGIEKRIDKAQGQLQKDIQQIQELQPYLEQLRQLETSVPPWRLLSNPDYQHFRWMVQEYRLSLFAQPMKTAMPVSPKRLDKLWEVLKHEAQAA